MLDHFLSRLVSWSPLRFWTYSVLVIFFAMEVTSWITSHVPPCIVETSQYPENNECPTQHVFIIVTVARVLEAMGHEWLTAIATAVIACFTIALARVGQRQTEDTRILQRAYLSIEPLGINPFVSENWKLSELIVAHINIVNVGRLPAKIFVNNDEPRIFVTQRILEDKELIYEKGVLVGVLPPGGKMPVGTKSIMDDSLGTDEYIYVWGKIDYFDGFGKPRFIRFCHRYPCRPYTLNPDGSKSIDAKHARYHEHGNEAD